MAIAIKKNCDMDMTASDLSKPALKIAKANAKRNSTDIKFILSDLFDKIESGFDLIVSNPPYIARDEIKTLSREVKDYDPLLALDGGVDGLDFYRRIAIDAIGHLTDRGAVILEIGYNQRQDIISIFKDYELLQVVPDLNGIDRVLVFKRSRR